MLALWGPRHAWNMLMLGTLAISCALGAGPPKATSYMKQSLQREQNGHSEEHEHSHPDARLPVHLRD